MSEEINIGNNLKHYLNPENDQSQNQLIRTLLTDFINRIKEGPHWLWTNTKIQKNDLHQIKKLQSTQMFNLDYTNQRKQFLIRLKIENQLSKDPGNEVKIEKSRQKRRLKDCTVLALLIKSYQIKSSPNHHQNPNSLTIMRKAKMKKKTNIFKKTKLEK